MPNKKDNDDKLKEMLDIINALKETNEDQEDIKLFEDMVNALIRANNRPPFLTILFKFLAFIFRIIFGSVLSLVMFGFLKDSIALDNKWMIILVALIISVILVIYDKIYWYKYDPIKKSCIPLCIFILLLALAFIFNTTIIKIFIHSSIWLFYLPLARMAYRIINGYFVRKFPTI